ncbi:cold shock domain-containing protein [Streptomyces sp. NPDC017890]|uniref:cold shock domain-containing protein n=1 Tax=Streptomyces sp. NPDC017890 TaxID=3365015 RepID=UPI0037BD4F57
MLMTGKVVRFDEVRGYGFIAPAEAGEDVFMHANDLLDEKYLYQEGREVEFFLEQGDKGPKASQIRLVHQPTAIRLPSRPAGSPDDRQDVREAGGNDATDAALFRAELTEALLGSSGTLTADQIKQVRECVVALARNRGWIAR